MTSVGPQPRPLPTASPSDGPAELEAKADILTDQSRRVRAAADALDARVAELKSRQDLRRRAAELDRDPFAPLEQSKRRTVSIASGGAATPEVTHGQPVPGPSAGGDRAGASSSGGSVSLTSTPAPAPQGQVTAGAVATPMGTPTPVTAAPLTASLELRDLLDPATVADLGRLERGRPPNSVAALQRAVAALRARAAALDTQAQAMRRAAQKP